MLPRTQRKPLSARTKSHGLSYAEYLSLRFSEKSSVRAEGDWKSSAANHNLVCSAADHNVASMEAGHDVACWVACLFAVGLAADDIVMWAVADHITICSAGDR